MSAQHQSRSTLGLCSVRGNPVSKALLAEASWYPYWDRNDGACPACVQQNLLQTLLTKGDAALHEAIQTTWPLDAEAAFGVLPTRLGQCAVNAGAGDVSGGITYLNEHLLTPIPAAGCPSRAFLNQYLTEFSPIPRSHSEEAGDERARRQ